MQRVFLVPIVRYTGDVLVGVLVGSPLVVGLLTAAVVSRWPRADPASPAVTGDAAHLAATELRRHHGLRRLVADRTNPAVATGLLLTLALVVAIGGASAVAVLALFVQRGTWVVDVDRSISSWVDQHATAFSHDVLQVVTQLGATELVVAAGLVVLAVEYRRRPSRWILPFFVVVLVGQSLLTNGIKEVLDRVRPTLNPAAHLLGPSFPSGHTATAAAFWAAVAVVAGRHRGPRAHQALAGAAVAAGVAVACTRVLLDVHWFSDVLAGLALGWSWFALSAVAFGGRILRLGAPVEVAERAIEMRESVPASAPQAAWPPVGIEQPGMEDVEQRSPPA
jgi:undecaprenyl-diphosphatase